MIVKLNNDTFRVQFIKEVEPRRGGRTTIKTICKIFKYAGEEACEKACEEYENQTRLIWELFSAGVARQNPVDKYNHLIGKRVALQHAMIKVPEGADTPLGRLLIELSEIASHMETFYHFDRVERSVFAQRLEREFDQSA